MKRKKKNVEQHGEKNLSLLEGSVEELEDHIEVLPPRQVAKLEKALDMIGEVSDWIEEEWSE